MLLNMSIEPFIELGTMHQIAKPSLKFASIVNLFCYINNCWGLLKLLFFWVVHYIIVAKWQIYFVGSKTL